MATIKINKYLDKDRIIFLQAETKRQAIKELWQLMTTSSSIRDKEDLLGKLFEREKIMSTGIGLGIGVPHVKLNSVVDFELAIGISKKGIDYNALDKIPVHIIIVVAAPYGKDSEYLKLLASIMKILNDEDIRNKIINADNVDSVYHLFELK